MAQNSLTDNQVAKKIIEKSIKSYPGGCACPYQTTKNGSKCGKRSAYSKSGGYKLLCYKNDVSNETIEKWRKKQ